MDGIVIVLALVVALIYVKATNSSLPGEISNTSDYVNTKVVEDDIDMSQRVVKLNDSYYEDQEAFMLIANALGFPKENN